MFDWFQKRLTEHSIKLNTASVVTGIFVGVWSLYKVYSSYTSSITLFGNNNNAEDIKLRHKICILITGCSSGIGYDLAMKLNNLGFCVIATCRRQESVDALNNNKEFIKHGSFSCIMDVSNIDSIKQCKNKVLNFLEEDKERILWSIVNNAGLIVAGNFEMTPFNDLMKQINVLFIGPIHVTRTFLPLIHGRRILSMSKYNNKNELNNNINKMISSLRNNDNNNNNINGGRIVNISSMMATLPSMNAGRVYGICKSGISYWTHGLRCEYASIFGIWSSAIEAGLFETKLAFESSNEVNGLASYYYDITDKNDYLLKNNLKDEEKEIANTYNLIKYCQMKQNTAIDSKKTMTNGKNTNKCTDDIIHAIMAKYPKRVYHSGVILMLRLIQNLPFWITDKIGFSIQEKMWQQAHQ